MPSKLAVVAALTLMLLPACGPDVEEPEAATSVRMGEFYFAPADITVPEGATIEVVNEGQVIHNWIVREAGRGTAEVRPGQRATLDLSGLEPGRYTIFCDQPGHTQAGQSGTLTIA